MPHIMLFPRRQYKKEFERSGCKRDHLTVKTHPTVRSHAIARVIKNSQVGRAKKCTRIGPPGTGPRLRPLSKIWGCTTRTIMENRTEKYSCQNTPVQHFIGGGCQKTAGDYTGGCQNTAGDYIGDVSTFLCGFPQYTLLYPPRFWTMV